MGLFRKNKDDSQGFTLVEVMVTVFIAFILSAIAAISLNSRMKTANLEGAAQTLLSDLSAARSTAMFKGCPIRLIFCANSSCSIGAGAPVDASLMSSGNVIGATTNPAQFYAFLRQSTGLDAAKGLPCYNQQAQGKAIDGYDYWDYDRKPQKIPRGIAFGAIYKPASKVPDASDWPTSTFDATSITAAANSLWFHSADGAIDTGIINGFTAAATPPGDPIVIQVQFDDCDPIADDCPAYHVVVGGGGDIQMQKCIPNAAGHIAAASNNNCFAR